ncbi:hypothetical protein PROFUN_06252 [Planoprotostelium fungivorum]|uniref:Transmembrane protein n=1 Tax=Planoprotostelium fungivorum TaxID=1890364 RepID=A0A2P6NE63_9EUKA|nr:hypothetical protein PROFUN_06252 [Planoprotostelium fungivorum]
MIFTIIYQYLKTWMNRLSKSNIDAVNEVGRAFNLTRCRPLSAVGAGDSIILETCTQGDVTCQLSSSFDGITLCLLLLATAFAGPVSWLGSKDGCNGKSVVFETPTCWSSGQVPGITDDVTVSPSGGTDKVNIVVTTNITVNSITVDKATLNIASSAPQVTTLLSVVNGGSLGYITSSELRLNVSIVSSALATTAGYIAFTTLNLTDASVSALNPSVGIDSQKLIMNGVTTILSSVGTASAHAKINWALGDGGLTLNGNYSSLFFVDSSFLGVGLNANVTVLGSPQYFNTPLGNIGFQDVTFYTSIETHWLVDQTVFFGDGSHIVFEKTQLMKRTLFDAGSGSVTFYTGTTITVNLKRSIYDIGSEDYYLIKSTSFKSADVAMATIKVISSYAEPKCMPTATTTNVASVGLQLTIPTYLSQEVVNDLEMNRGSDIYSAVASFSPVEDPCIKFVSYVVVDDLSNRVVAKQIGDKYQANFTRVSSGPHNYRVTVTFLDENYQQSVGYSNTYTYTRPLAGTAAAATFCIGLVVSCIALLF